MLAGLARGTSQLEGLLTGVRREEHRASFYLSFLPANPGADYFSFGG